MSTSTPGADDFGFELIPPDDTAVSPEVDLAAAAASALEDPTDPREVAEDAPEPFGVSWRFDYDVGRFVRAGTSPARVAGTDALIEWCMTALHTARFAHPIFSEDFGMEAPNDMLGDAVGDEAEADYVSRIRDALLVHDRIVEVTDFEIEFDPASGVLYIHTFTVVTDEEERVPFSNVTISTTGA